MSVVWYMYRYLYRFRDIYDINLNIDIDIFHINFSELPESTFSHHVSLSVNITSGPVHKVREQGGWGG